MPYSGLGQELEKYRKPAAKVGLSGTFGGEFLFLDDRTLLQSVLAVDRIRNPGKYVYVTLSLEKDLDKQKFLDLSNELLEAARRDDEDFEETSVYYVIPHKLLRKHHLRETIAYVCEFVFETPLVVMVALNERTSGYFPKIPMQYCLDLREANFSSDMTKAIASLRLNVQNRISDPNYPEMSLQLVLLPWKLPLVLRVLVASTGADVVYGSAELMDGVYARNYAAANYYYELSKAASKSAAKKGSAYAYGRFAMQYLLNDKDISPERHEKTAKMFHARGPWNIEEYSTLLPPNRGQLAKAEINKIYRLSEKIVGNIGRYRAQVVGSMASYYRDLKPGDIDVVVVAANEMQFKSIINNLVSFLHGAELETDDPKKIARIRAMGIYIDLFSVPSLTSMEAHSRILSSVELRYYRGLAKSQGMFLSDGYLETGPGRRIRDIREALRHIGIYDTPKDIRDFRNWYYGLTSH